ncbi:predicted protein [Nematostella vectensis]|uniref:G-protein coupled receptors family 1 profile domain-containing protein n=1 Tax=Nematostella vectensis TaxID=45351 RepID=A7TCH5_NEMVE|nr:predicted protein [Nematostella vectensis]|eukprot:XP_001618351.1 hypothetical protein NEMVEDRAFT_v1g225244 [Nematostella vectensis]
MDKLHEEVCQEFLALMMDKLHEDVCQIRHKPYLKAPDDNIDPAEAANITWDNHRKRNESLMLNLFDSVDCCKQGIIIGGNILTLAQPYGSRYRFYEVSVSNRTILSEEQTRLNVYVAVLGVLLVCGCVSNSTVILLVIAKRVPRKTINLFVVNMALADLMTILLDIPYKLKIYSRVNTTWPGGWLGDVTCRLFSWLFNVINWVSPLTLLVISIERFKAVSSTVQQPGLSRCLVVVFVSLSWLLSGLLNLPGFFICYVKPRTNFCGCYYTRPTSAYFVGTNGLYVCLVITILSINFAIIRRLVRSEHSVNLPEAQRQKRLRTFRSAVCMVLCQLLLFVFCATPLFAFVGLLHLDTLGIISIPFDSSMLIKHLRLYSLQTLQLVQSYTLSF